MKMIYLIIILLGFVFGMLFGFCAGMLAGVFIGEEKHVRKHQCDKEIHRVEEMYLNDNKQYKDLKGKCKTCLGCNQLELKKFNGVYECKNYMKGSRDEKTSICSIQGR